MRLSDDTVVGTVCAFDEQARVLSGQQVALPADLGLQAAAQLELTWLAVDLDEQLSAD